MYEKEKQSIFYVIKVYKNKKSSRQSWILNKPSLSAA